MALERLAAEGKVSPDARNDLELEGSEDEMDEVDVDEVDEVTEGKSKPSSTSSKAGE